MSKSAQEKAPRAATRPPKREARIWKFARLMIFGVGVCLAGAAVAARSAYGDVTDSALVLGGELGKMRDVGVTSPLRLNGEAIRIASTIDPRPLDEVLDKMEATCRQSSAALFKELDDLPREVLANELPGGGEGAEARGIVRRDEAGRGYVACFARGAGERASLAETSQRLARVLETGNLGELGKLRYLYGERTGDGQTHIVAVWTDGPFNLYSLFPQQGGDAPGADPKDAPRPPGATRLLSAHFDGAPYGVRIYQSKASVGEVLAVYDREMPTRGWEPLRKDPNDSAQQRAFHRPGVDLLVFLDEDAQEGTLVSLVEMRAD